MASLFEQVTKVALEEIIVAHAKESKFGYIISKEAMAEIVADTYQLIATSRTLKAAGDRVLQGASDQAAAVGQRGRRVQ